MVDLNDRMIQQWNVRMVKLGWPDGIGQSMGKEIKEASTILSFHIPCFTDSF